MSNWPTIDDEPAFNEAGEEHPFLAMPLPGEEFAMDQDMSFEDQLRDSLDLRIIQITEYLSSANDQLLLKFTYTIVPHNLPGAQVHYTTWGECFSYINQNKFKISLDELLTIFTSFDDHITSYLSQAVYPIKGYIESDEIQNFIDTVAYNLATFLISLNLFNWNESRGNKFEALRKYIVKFLAENTFKNLYQLLSLASQEKITVEDLNINGLLLKLRDDRHARKLGASGYALNELELSDATVVLSATSEQIVFRRGSVVNGFRKKRIEFFKKAYFIKIIMGYFREIDSMVATINKLKNSEVSKAIPDYTPEQRDDVFYALLKTEVGRQYIEAVLAGDPDAIVPTLGELLQGNTQEQ
jgi:hypothetical protein